MNFVQDMPSVFRSIREYGSIWMEILFDELFSIFREMSFGEDTWVSPPTTNYVYKAIKSGPYPIDYAFTHVALDYEYPQPRTISFQCMYEYDTDINITATRLRNFYAIKLDVCRTYEDDNASTTYIGVVRNRTKYSQRDVGTPI